MLMRPCALVKVVGVSMFVLLNAVQLSLRLVRGMRDFENQVISSKFKDGKLVYSPMLSIIAGTSFLTKQINNDPQPRFQLSCENHFMVNVTMVLHIVMV